MGIVDYRTGIVHAVADLLTALQTACTDNGWTLTAGGVLHKTDAASGNTCYANVYVQGQHLRLRGGTGIDGSGVLTGQVRAYNNSELYLRLGNDVGLLPAATYPWTYHIHVYDDPDCVFLIINYNGDMYQHMEFGVSNLDIPGNGTWVSATVGRDNNRNGGFTLDPRGGSGSAFESTGWIFGRCSQPWYMTGFIHHGFPDANPARMGGWSKESATNNFSWGTPGHADLSLPIGRLMDSQPSAFNSRPVPQPAVLRLRREDANVSVVATIPALRFLRIDNLAPEEIFHYGSDAWKVYPFYRKNIAARDGGGTVQHTGTMGFCLAWDDT
jgi:hypothetical protein